ncbi:hypothetical protein QLL95_gp0078 [Cotonvirus japonicus]|uniref:Uncharacterized protein n=1 Tax=Cotonvirus japonicus TaxID=2811091 RepID=A0ABM7NR46_9VIRU|nr:hypothetical protein QLL95_gp0078 [Cotonvirus japonicus]BCS82567.1 hypothetical protein [Cotonvirus japonicus]
MKFHRYKDKCDYNYMIGLMLLNSFELDNIKDYIIIFILSILFLVCINSYKSKMFNHQTKNINGPVNVARLEGKINNIKKIIYVFMDYHLDVTQQSECDNIYSHDIQLYLAENFYQMSNSDKIYDFFFETRPTYLVNINDEKYRSKRSKKYKYITEVDKLFQKIFKFNREKNLTKISDILPNIRLHYVDIRDYFFLINFEEMETINNILNEMWTNHSLHHPNLKLISYTILNMKKKCEFLIEILTSKKPVNKNTKIIKYDSEKISSNENSTNENLIYLIDKIFDRYHNNNTKIIMSKQKDILIDYLQQLITLFDDTTKIITDGIGGNDDISYINNTRIALTKLLNNWLIFESKEIKFFTRFMDVYFLRRFLDKDYITNAITYTGEYHSFVYIEILMRDFNFKLTHISYPKDINIDELNQQIKNKNADELSEFLKPKEIIQCSDVSHFPKLFS